MLREHVTKERWLSFFPSHVHRVSAIVFIRVRARSRFPHCVNQLLNARHTIIFLLYMSRAHQTLSFSLLQLPPPFCFVSLSLSFSSLRLLFLNTQLHTRVTYAAVCNQRSFSRVISFRIRFPLVVHSCFYYSSCQNLNIRHDSCLVSVKRAST